VKFKLGGSVRITAPYSRHFDAVGTVTNIDRTKSVPFGVSGLDRLPLWFGAHELVLVEYSPNEEPS
jgi:hypothetical protein